MASEHNGMVLRYNADEIIGFHLITEPHGCFSNWFPSPFHYAGIAYNCAEQYMMAQKVAMGGRPDLRQEIMGTEDPERIKALGGKEHFPEFMSIKPLWDRHCRQIVKRGVRAKFMQNPEMLGELLATGRALLAECAGQDRIWGIGINLQNPAWHDAANWNGSNYLGQILMEVREELGRELRERGAVRYVEYRDAGAIPEWKVPILRLKRFPQYYRTIHVYGDQIPEGELRNAFYGKTPEDIEEMLRRDERCGYPAAGFFEMKQELYEIAER